MARESRPPSPLATQTAFRFVQQWSAGDRPRIEDSLASVPPSERPNLFQSLLTVEVNARRTRGESPMASEYLARFPQFHTHIVSSLGTAPAVTVPATVSVPMRSNRRWNILGMRLVIGIGAHPRRDGIGCWDGDA